MLALKDKIWNIWMEDRAADTPEIAVKKRCTPALFYDTLLERNSLVGCATVFLRSWCRIENEEERWKAIFQKVFSTISEKEAERFPGSRGFHLYQLYNPEKNTPCLINLEGMFAPLKLNSSSSSDFFKEHSLLGKEERGNADLLFYPPEFLPLESLIPLAGDESLNRALERREQLKSMNIKGAAEAMLAEVKGMKGGEVKLHLASLPAISPMLFLPKAPHPAAAALQNFLLENRGAEGVAQNIVECASPELRSALKNPILAEAIKEAMALLENNDFGWLSAPLPADAPRWKQILLAPAEWVRGKAEQITRQFKDNLLAGLKARIGMVLSPALQEELYQLIKSNGDIKDALEARATAYLTEKLNAGKKYSDRVLPSIGENLPALVPMMLDYSGSGTLGRLEQPFWLEWSKGSDGELTLAVYITGNAMNGRPQLDGAPQSVLLYSVPEKELDAEFFYALLAYQQKQSSAVFSFQDVETNLLSRFGNFSTSSTCKSQIAHLSSGHWGLIQEYALKKKGGKPALWYFIAKRSALIHLWGQGSHAENKQVLERNALELAKQALELQGQGLLSPLGLKRTYATCHEVIASLSRLSEKKDTLLFPPWLKTPFTNLFSAIGCTTANLNFVKEVLVDALGEGAREHLEQLLQVVQEDLGTIEAPPPLIKVPAEVQGAIQTWSMAQTAWKTARFALNLIFNPVQMVTFVALRALNACFPATMMRLNRLKQKVMLRTLLFLLPGKFKRLLDDAIVAFRQMVASEKEISFAINPELENAEGPPLRPSAIPISLNTKRETIQEDHECFLQSVPEITPANVKGQLMQWCAEAGRMEQDADLYLNRQISSFPLLSNAFWDKVDDVDGCIKVLDTLALCLGTKGTPSRSKEEQHHTIINLYTLYAIIEILAKRSKNSGLGDRKRIANPMGLYHWVDQPNFRLLDLNYDDRLKRLWSFFFPFLPKDALTSVNDFSSSIDLRLVEEYTFFKEQEEDRIDLDQLNLNNVSLSQYFLSLLAFNPAVKAHLERMGLSDAPLVEKVAVLYTNEEGILPQAFSSLRNLHQICNGKIREYETKNRLPLLPDFSIHYREHPIRMIVNVVTFGRFFRSADTKDSLFRSLPAAFTAMRGKLYNVTSKVKVSVNRHLLDFSFDSFMSHRDASVRERKSQAEVINGTSHDDQPHRHHYMMLSSRKDEVVRVLSYFRENPEELLSEAGMIRLEHSLLRENLLRDQQKENPEFIETVAQFFQDTFQWLEKNKAKAPQLLYLAILVHLEAEGLNLPFPIDQWLQPKAKEPYYKSLVALKYSLKDPRLCSIAEQRKIGEELLSAFHLPTTGEIDEDFVAIQEETMARWKPFIKKLFIEDPSYKQQVLNRLGQVRGLGPEAELKWEGEWPVYTLGKYELNLFDTQREDYSKKIASFLHAGICDMPVEISSFKDGECEVKELGLKVKLDLGAGTFRLIKNYEGEEYHRVRWQQPDDKQLKHVSYWLSSKGRMLKMENGAVTKQFDVKEKTAEFTLVKEGMMWNGEWLDLVSLPPLLATLARFQPNILCYSSTPGQMKLLQFPALKLSFEVKNNKAESVGDFPGYCIAPLQRLESLNAYGSYLLLQNNELEKKVLLPFEGIYTSFLSGLSKKFQFGEAIQLQSWFESLAALTSQKYFEYSIDKEGRLTSTDPAAITHLFLYHLGKWNLKEVKFYLKSLEGLSKREKLPEMLHKATFALHFIAAMSQDGELLMIALRLTALLNVHSALQPSEEEIVPEKSLFSFCAIQYNYNTYLARRKFIFPPISPYQEISIIKAIYHESKKVLASKYLPDVLRPIIEEAHWMLEMSAILPEIRRRYKELSERFAPQLAPNDPLWKRFGMEYGAAAVLGEDVNQIASSTGPKFLASLLEMGNFRRLSKNVCYGYSSHIIPWENLKTQFAETRPEDLDRYFLSYYALARGTASNDPVFIKKAEELKRTLLLLQGRYSNKSIGFSVKLLHLIISSPNRFVFPKPEALRVNLEAEMMIVVNQCTADELMTKGFKAGLNLAGEGIKTYLWDMNMAMNGISPFYIEALKMGYRGWQALKKVTEGFPQEEKHPLSNQKMDAPLAAAYRQKDAEIEKSLSDLSHVFFEESKEEAPQTFFPFISDDPVIDHYFQKINQSQKDYAKRTPGKLYKLKGIYNLYTLQSKLEKAADDISLLIRQERENILKSVESAFFKESEGEEGIKKSIFKLFDAPADFDALLICFLQGDRQELQRRWNLSAKEIDALDQQLYHYLILATREQQIRKCAKMTAALHKDPKDSARFEQNVNLLAEELNRVRAYSFDQLPERLVRGHLLFEYKQESLLWIDQVTKITTMLTSGYIRSYVELIMGSGKTHYGIPITDIHSADGKSITINSWPAAMEKTNISQIAPQAEKLAQDAYAMSFGRNEALTPEILEGRLLILVRAGRELGQINMSKEKMQSLELIWLEYLHKQKQQGTPVQGKCLDLLTELNRLIRFEGRGVIDEVHETLRRDQILNHPLGQKKSLREGDIAVTEEFVRGLFLPAVMKHLNVRDNQKTTPKAVYWNQVRPLLADYLCQSKLFDIPFEERLMVKMFLLQQAKGPIPPWIVKHPHYRELSLARGLINAIAPQALRGIISVGYGPSRKGGGKFARPYRGNQTPKEQATIQSPFEACLKTYLQQLGRPFGEEAARELLDLLRAQAQAESDHFGTPLEQTEAGKKFGQWCKGYTFDNCPIDQAAALFEKQPEAILMHASRFIAPTVHYYDRFFSSNSQNFASMVPGYYAGSGTPSNEETYPTGTKGIRHEGTVGESIDWLLNHCQNSLVEIAATDPEKAAQEILGLFSDKTKAIIDCGALFRGVDNEKIASMMQPKFPGVAFFTGEDKLVVMEGGSVIPIAESKVSKENLAALFDDSHTFAANIPLDLEAEGILTIGENITLTRLLQGMWRLRGLKKGRQTLRIVLNGNVRRLISGDALPTIEQIIRFAAENEAQLLADDNYFADHQKVHNVLRRAVLDKLLKANNHSEMFKLFDAFESLLLNRMEDDPVVLYGQPVNEATPIETLTKLKEEGIDQAQKSDWFTGQEMRELQDRYEELFKEIAGRVYPKATPQQEGLEQIETLTTEEKTERSVTLDQNIDRTLVSEEDEEPKLLKSKEWDLGLDYFKDFSWLKNSPITASLTRYPHLYSLTDVLGKAAMPILSECKEAFAGPIWCSENFVGNNGDFFSAALATPFRKNQKPIYEVLVTQSDKGYSIGILDQSDADQWRALLSQNKTPSACKIALVDVTLNRVVATGANPLTSRDLEPLQSDLARIKILQGSVQYSHGQLEILRKWIKEWGAFKMHTLFNQVHDRFGVASKSGTAIEHLFLTLEEGIRNGIRI